MLGLRSPLMRCARPSTKSAVKCQAVLDASRKTTRRGMITTGLVSAAAVAFTGPAMAYGGAKTLRAMDAGSGNKDYDALMAAVKERQAKSKNTDFADASGKLEAKANAPVPTSGRRRRKPE